MERWIEINTEEQSLLLWQDDHLLQQYTISTAANGLGEKIHSGCTPRGWHCIRLKIGQGCPLYTVFVARRPTGEIYSPELGKRYPQRDWILSRILWLSGLEKGLNRGGNRDSLRRYIYIHGTNEEERLGSPVSHGCIRMGNRDIIDLFDQIEPWTKVWIH